MKYGLFSLALVAVVMGSPGLSGVASADDVTDRLERAEPYRTFFLRQKLLNYTTTPNWIPETSKFWIDLQTREGHEFQVIDASTGEQSPAFDHERMAEALGASLQAEMTATALPIWSINFTPGMAGVVVVANGQPFRCDLPVTACEPLAAAEAGAAEQPARMSMAPDGQRMVYLKDHNLWLRHTGEGDDQQLTTDGIEDFSYGDVDAYIDFLKVVRRRYHLPEMFNNVVWSPDSRYVLALRQDMKTVSEKLLVTEYLPPDGSYDYTHSARIGSAIEEQRPPSVLTLIDTETGQSRTVDIDEQALNDYALIYYMGGLVWWSDDGSNLFLIGANRGGTDYRLLRVNIETGAVEQVIQETGTFSVRLNPLDYSKPNVGVLKSGKEGIWYSERTGWGHLYLYDLTNGKVKHAITSGDWVVSDLLRVDEDKRKVYFTAMGREKGRNPYYRHLYVADIDTGKIKLLTPEDADHDFKALYPAVEMLNAKPTSSFSPDGEYFADTYSTLDQPPVMVVRDKSGKLISKVMESDSPAFSEMGIAPPERVVVKAADGVTDLYGVIYNPFDLDPSMKYPVINYTYPGPQGRWAPVTYSEGILGLGNNAYALAKMGFVVVMIDGRGTAQRSLAFRDAFLGTDDPLGAEDQVAAIRDLAASRPWMDLDRVGVTGASFGGYGALRDMLLYPDFFKVGVAIAGPQDFSHLTQAVTAERYFGDPGRSDEAREYYRVSSNTALADRLDGDLLLVYGVTDENVAFKHGLEIFDALIRANKTFDTIVLPDAAHGISVDPYVVRRMMAYFAEKLGGPVPQD